MLREPTLERCAIATLTTTAAVRVRALRSSAVLAALTPAALLLITGAGAALRLARLGDVPGNPFYDAAVHTMSQSWHAFLFGALDPSGGVSVDKPPVDLWVQVASVKLLGFNPTALKLPQALAGTLSVPLLFDVVRRPFGRVAGLGAAAALAVLPIAVMTARSDTMDTFMVFLLLAGVWLVVRAAASGRLGWLLAAGALVGLAFNVKLFQALLPVPALAVMWMVASPLPLRRRVGHALAAAAVAVVVALAWIVPVALTPLSQRPYPIGSTNGSIWNLVFTFNGLDRLRGRPLTTPDTLPPGSKVSAQIARAQRHRSVHLSTNGGPARLFGTRYAARIGSELAPALLIAAFLLIAFVLARARRSLALAAFALFATWALTGAALFSLIRSFHPRYFETVSPAVAALLGAGLFVLAQRFGRWGRLAAGAAVAAGAVYAGVTAFGAAVSTQAAHAELVLGLAAAALLAASALRRTVPPAVSTSVTALALCTLLIVPASASRTIVHTRAYDAERSGAMPHSWPPLINRYLRLHRGHARYSFASIAPAKAAPLIANHPQPVLMLTSYRSRPLLTVAQLARKVRAGEVRYFLIGRRCTSALTRQTAACPATARWAIAHGTDVTRAVGLGHQRLLFRVDARQASAGRRRGR